MTKDLQKRVDEAWTAEKRRIISAAWARVKARKKKGGKR